MRSFGLAIITVALLATAPAAQAHHPGDDSPHGDPRSALPDSLVTQPVAQAEMAAIQPETLDAAGPSLPETWCGTETAANNTANQTVAESTAHFKLIYAYAADQPNRFGDLPSRTDDRFADRLQATVSLLGRYMATQSGERKAPRWDMGSSCATNPGQYVDVQVVRLPENLAYYNETNYNARFNKVDEHVRSLIGATPQGSGSGPRNLMIYVDAFFKPDAFGSGIAGQGSVYRGGGGSDSPDFPWHDAGGLTATVYGPANPPTNGYAWPAPMLHEMTHNMGAVQNTAPHTSGAGHCDDRYDVMCYPDGGPSYSQTFPCAKNTGVVDETYDCGGDDYFNPAPTADNYLATHWNLFNSAHLAPCAEDRVACGVAPPVDTTPPTNTTASAGDAWRTSSYSVALSGADTESTVDGWEWKVGAGAVQTTQTATVSGDGSHTLATRVRDAAGNWSDWRSETVRIDGTAPAAAHGCPEAWRPGAASCALSGSDATSGVARLEYTIGTGALQSATGATGTAAVSSSGETPVRVRAYDNAGNVSPAWTTGTVRIDGTDPVAGVACEDGWKATSVACTITASDAGGSGLGSLSWRAGDGTPQTVANGAVVTISTAGASTITATATDGAGRTRSANDSASVDATAPAAEVSCPDAWSATAVSCTVTAADAQSGLKSVTWRVNDGAVRSGPSGSTVQVSADGASTVTATATDNVDRTATASDTARVDTTAPTATVSCPSTWGATSTTCTIDGADGAGGSGLKTLSWRVGGGAPQSGPAGSTVVVDQHGATPITATATDNVERTGTGTGSARVDKVAPTAAVACPDAWSAGTVECTVTAADADSSIKSLTWTVDGGAPRSGPSGSTVSVPGHGVHEIAATATDNVDRTAQARDTARVDENAPAAGVDCADGWSRDTVTCTITGADGAGESGTKSLTWRVNGGAPASGPSGSTVSLSSHGVHTVAATTTDNVDRTATATDAARVDTVDPTVGVACPAGWSAGPVTCTVTGADADSGLQPLSWQVDDAAAETGPSGSTVTVAGHGPHTVRATATDQAGRSVSTTRSASVDTTAPVVSLTCPSGWQSSTTGCALTATDDESGVAERRIRSGGTGTGVAWAEFGGTPFEGRHDLNAWARNGAGTASTWSADVPFELDLTAPRAAIGCDPIGAGRHRCTPTAADDQSGLAEVRLVRDGIAGATVTAGQPIELDGPGMVAVSAVDRVGRATTSASTQLAGAPLADSAPAAGPAQDPAPSPPAGATGTAATAPSNDAVVRRATGTATIKAGRRRLGAGTLELLAGPGGRRVLSAPRLASLPNGTWRLQLCVAGGRCVRKNVKLRKAGRPPVLHADAAAPAGEVRVTFTVLRKAGSRFLRYAGGATSAKLG